MIDRSVSPRRGTFVNLKTGEISQLNERIKNGRRGSRAVFSLAIDNRRNITLSFSVERQTDDALRAATTILLPFRSPLDVAWNTRPTYVPSSFSRRLFTHGHCLRERRINLPARVAEGTPDERTGRRARWINSSLSYCKGGASLASCNFHPYRGKWIFLI